MIYEVNKNTYAVSGYSSVKDEDSLKRLEQDKVLVELDRKIHVIDKEKIEVSYLGLTLAEKALVDKEALDVSKKYIGMDYQGSLIPLSSDDAMAMLQVKSAFELGLTATNIKFSNGVILPMTPAEFVNFSLWFVTSRNTLFT